MYQQMIGGLLLVGSVIQASISSPGQSLSNEDSKVMYKVLFIEGGSDSTMFRCKTPVFSSPPVNDLMRFSDHYYP